MFYLTKHPPLLSASFFPLISVFLFFFFSCTHFEPLKLPNNSIEVQSKNQNDKKSFNSLVSGWSLFKEGKLNEARSQLENLNYGGESFLPAILEIQKINYIEKDWDRFFALASYYRKRLLYSTEISVENFRQEMLALEILALIRHCRLSEALRIIEWSLWLAREINKDSSTIQKTVHFFKLKTKIGEKKVQKIDWERQINLWPVDTESVKRLGNPKHLRMKVNSQC